jgi:hypothetical protein
MYREYDLFEKFPDGSSLWRVSVAGLRSARIHLLELAQKSENSFYAIDLVSGKIVYSDLRSDELYLLQHQEVRTRSKPAAA